MEQQKDGIFFSWFFRAISSGRVFLTVSSKKTEGKLSCGCKVNGSAGIRWIKGKGFIHEGKDGCRSLLVEEEKFLDKISLEKVEIRDRNKSKVYLKKTFYTGSSSYFH